MSPAVARSRSATFALLVRSGSMPNMASGAETGNVARKGAMDLRLIQVLGVAARESCQRKRTARTR